MSKGKRRYDEISMNNSSLFIFSGSKIPRMLRQIRNPQNCLLTLFVHSFLIHVEIDNFVISAYELKIWMKSKRFSVTSARLYSSDSDTSMEFCRSLKNKTS